jgi:hypothetical protein
MGYIKVGIEVTARSAGATTIMARGEIVAMVPEMTVTETMVMVAMVRVTTVMAMAIRMHPAIVVAIITERTPITVGMETVVMETVIAAREMATEIMVAAGVDFRIQMVQAHTKKAHTGLSPSVPRIALLQ